MDTSGFVVEETMFPKVPIVRKLWQWNQEGASSFISTKSIVELVKYIHPRVKKWKQGILVYNR